MNGVPLMAAAGAAVLLFGLVLMIFALQNFSRSRLEEICRQQDRLDRFAAILKHHQKWLLLCVMASVLTLMLLTWLITQHSYFKAFLLTEWQWVPVLIWVLRLFSAAAVMCLSFVMLPWTIAHVHGEAVLFHAWPLLKLPGRLASPIWHIAVRLDRMIHRVFGVPEPDFTSASGELIDEILTLVEEGSRQGVIQSNASSMIRRVIDLQTEDVAAIMTPRTDMITIHADTPLQEANHAMLDNGFSRVPVVRDGVDDIVGILYARDLLAFATDGSARQEPEKTVRDIARDVMYAPESQGIGDLLEAMRQQKVHMAVIVDEYSGVSGLVTLEDILEEIVGDINDEYDSEDDTLWKHHSDGCTEVDARYHLDDLNEEFGYEFPEDEEFDTIGGFVMSCFGRIPAVGEQHVWKDLKLTVMDADERRLIRVRIEGDTHPSDLKAPRPVTN